MTWGWGIIVGAVIIQRYLGDAGAIHQSYPRKVLEVELVVHSKVRFESTKLPQYGTIRSIELENRFCVSARNEKITSAILVNGIDVTDLLAIKL